KISYSASKGMAITLRQTMKKVALRMEIGILFRDYRRGHLFPLRNATFFIVCLSVIAIPLLALYEIFVGPYLQTTTLLLIPVFLWMCTQNLFRVRIDNVSFLAKMGFRAPTEVPLFRITKVEEDERGIDVVTDEGKTVRLLRPFFFPAVWEQLRERLRGLG
ncbi:MAG: hypothetical protein AAFN92_21710, partial [Bacteroidota bacterium]